MDKKTKMFIAVLLIVILGLAIWIITDHSSGEKSVPQTTSSLSERQQQELQHKAYVNNYMEISDVKTDTTGKSYAYCTGKITNNGTASIRFVQVKGVFKDWHGNVIDTDWTYAVGSDWLDPGESKKFELSVKADSSIGYCQVSPMFD